MKFEELKDTDKYVCDSCKGVFNPSKIKFSDPIDNITMTPGMMISFLYVDKDGKIMGGREQPTKEKGDKLFTCPLCDFVHLFGFDKFEEE